jgi:2-polyprenyl-6-methoxyphenol hydroxylase-like FAD-dependent oxidoreductase
MMQLIGKQVVIAGGSIAGLCAARALSPYAEKIIIVERDERPLNSDPRKAVPQGNHVHVLLGGGKLALEQLFPNLVQDLLLGGASQIDFSEDVCWYHAGHWKLRYPSGLSLMVQSRPLLEQVIRRRVEQFNNVEFYYSYEVEQLRLTPDQRKIAGVTLNKMTDRSQKINLAADLLVDASGRGSKMPQWLEMVGFLPPQETKIKIDLTYSSRLYRAPDTKTFDWRLLVINPHSPKYLRAGYIFPIENQQWLVTFAGYSGDTTPHDNASFAAYARDLAQPDLAHLLPDLTPLSDVRFYSVPYTVRRHYEKLNMPQGVLVLGDAMCAFDPVFGQGMSVAAQEALALGEMLADETERNLAALTKRFHRTSAKIAAAPWMLSSSEDFRYPNTEGERGILLPILHWYSQRIFELSSIDKTVYESFASVMHLFKGPEALFRPAIVYKVMQHLFGAKAVDYETTPAPRLAPK